MIVCSLRYSLSRAPSSLDMNNSASAIKMRSVPRPRAYTPIDRLYCLWFLCMIDMYPNDYDLQHQHLSPRAIADEFGEAMLDKTIFYMDELRDNKLLFSRNYILYLTPRGQEIVDTWKHQWRKITDF